MELSEAQQSFVEMLDRLGNPDKVQSFLGWIQQNWQPSRKSYAKEDEILDDIAAELRSVLPFHAQFQSEAINAPASGENADCNPESMVNVDAFLFDDDLIDELSDQGLVPRSYCLSCGSKKTKPLILISHSTSRNMVRHIFCNLLPPLDGKTVVDIGFRLGAVLYGAYLFSSAKSIRGVELNPDFYDLTSKIVEKYKMLSRVQLFLGDVRAFPQLVASGDVVFMNNVFEFFMGAEEQHQMWLYVRQCIKPGALLVTIPSLQTLLLNVNAPIRFDEWVEELPSFSNSITDIDPEEVENIRLYRVK